MNRLSKLVLIVAGLLMTGSAGAQDVRTVHEKQGAISLEVLHPMQLRSADLEPSPLSSVFFLGGSWNAGRAVTLEADVPLAYASVESASSCGCGSPFASDVRLGNPYLGASWAPWGAGVRAHLELRLPISWNLSTPVSYVGRYTDVARAEAFTEGILPIYGRLSYTVRPVGGIGLRMEGGTGYQQPARGLLYGARSDWEESLMLIQGRIRGFYETGQLHAAVTLFGHRQTIGGFRTLFASNPLSASLLRLRLDVKGRFGAWQPGVVALAPVGHRGTRLDQSPTVGLQLSYLL